MRTKRTDELQAEIYDEYTVYGLPQRVIAKKHELSQPTVSRWVRDEEHKLTVAGLNMELADARMELADTRMRLADTQMELADTRMRLADAQMELADARMRLAGQERHIRII